MKSKNDAKFRGAESSKTNGSFKKGASPPRNQPCLREVFPQYPWRSDRHEALQLVMITVGT